MKKSLIINVYGKVQNVGFRYYTQKTALENHITGFVCNKSDGSVYIEAEGEESELESFVVWLHDGPQWAIVQEVKTQYTPLQGFKEFRVK